MAITAIEIVSETTCGSVSGIGDIRALRILVRGTTSYADQQRLLQQWYQEQEGENHAEKPDTGILETTDSRA